MKDDFEKRRSMYWFLHNTFELKYDEINTTTIYDKMEYTNTEKYGIMVTKMVNKHNFVGYGGVFKTNNKFEQVTIDIGNNYGYITIPISDKIKENTDKYLEEYITNFAKQVVSALETILGVKIRLFYECKELEE